MEVESDVSSGAAIRYLETGPKFIVTSTNGIRRFDNQGMDIAGYQNLLNFRAIQAQSGNHYLNVQYYR